MLVKDLSYAFRSLLKSPAFALTAVFTIAPASARRPRSSAW